jgi:hypothetical protein
VTAEADRGLETMAAFVGAANVERSRDYAGFPSAWNALAAMRAALAEYDE